MTKAATAASAAGLEGKEMSEMLKIVNQIIARSDSGKLVTLVS